MRILGRYEIIVQRWDSKSRFFDVRLWQTGHEKTSSGDRLYWFGPLHIAISPLLYQITDYEEGNIRNQYGDKNRDEGRQDDPSTT